MPNDAGQLLKIACDNAYDQYPDSCSHAVWSVMRARGQPNQDYRTANALIDYLIANWLEVGLTDGHALAMKGEVVIGGLKGTAHGHVILIYPAASIESGGYQFLYKKKNSMIKMRSHGKYPPCMSTSIGSWPGAMSKGDKTVWDPWGDDNVFEKVKSWALKEKSAQT